MSNAEQTIKGKVKKHIPKDWLCEIRIAYRIVKEVVNDLKRTGIVNLFIITTMAAILTIFAALFRTTLSLSEFASQLGNVLEISVYLKNGTDVNSMGQRIKALDNVVKVKLITKEESWNDLKHQIQMPDISNPLPDTLRVKVNKPENIKTVLDTIKTFSGVEDISYAEELAKKIQILTHIANITMFVVIITVAFLTITIINNTIQLVIQSRKDEIEIMRLMGVSNWYIKTPLVLQGAFYGFTAALLAVIPLKIVNNLLLNVHNFFLVPSPSMAENIVVTSLLLVGILFGAGGSFFSIKKYLQV